MLIFVMDCIIPLNSQTEEPELTKRVEYFAVFAVVCVFSCLML